MALGGAEAEQAERQRPGVPPHLSISIAKFDTEFEFRPSRARALLSEVFRFTFSIEMETERDQSRNGRYSTNRK